MINVIVLENEITGVGVEQEQPVIVESENEIARGRVISVNVLENETVSVGAERENPVNVESENEIVRGIDGYSPTANVTKSGNKATITITDKNGTTTAEVTDGTDGVHTWAELENKPDTFPPSEHTHDDRYYTETETNQLLSGKADAVHTHDDRYYTESETNQLLSGKAAAVHTHDDRYYTEAEIDSKIGDVVAAINTIRGV